MNPPPAKATVNTQWESVHICPQCGHILSLEGIGLRTITTGIVECPECRWEGPVEIKVVNLGEGPVMKRS
jgi:predicted RNA-binding Zn-ribbon protein involved in translation (DUF1610 family)